MSGLNAPFAQRRLNVTFRLGAGTFAGTGTNTITFAAQPGALGFRANVQLVKSTQPNTVLGDTTLYGLSLDHINQLTVAGLVFRQRKQSPNVIQIDAGDDVSGLSTVHVGYVQTAEPNFDQPDAPLHVTSSGGIDMQLKTVPPNSFASPTDAGTALAQLATQAGISFVNNGVNASFAGLYLPGTLWTQMTSVCRAADCFGSYDDVSNTFTIWPKNGAAPTVLNPIVISATTGMIGYPHFQALRVIVRALFDTATIGSMKVNDVIQIQSQLQAANGLFRVLTMQYNLSSETPGGPWEATLTTSPAS